MRVIALSMVCLAFVGCGAGTTGNTSSTSRSIGGYAIDGYLADAEVRCLDAAGTVIATARSVSTGAWVMRTRSAATCQLLESEGGVDIGRGLGDAAERSPLPPGTRFSANIAHIDPVRLASLQIVISPLTSLIHSLQTQRSMSAEAARSAVLLALGLPDSLDPLVDSPLRMGNADMFGMGTLTAATIREASAGILEAIAGSGQTVSLDLRRSVHQRVTDSFAELARRGDLNRITLGDNQPTPQSPLSTMVADALTRLGTDPAPISGALARLQPDSVRTIVAQYAGRNGSQLMTAIATGSPSQIAQVSATISETSQSNLLRPQVLAALGTEAGLDLGSVAEGIRNSIAGQTDFLRVRRNNGSDLVVPLSTVLRDYLQISGEELRFFTTTTGSTGQAVSVTDFEFGRAPTLPGALSAVALGLTQPTSSQILSADSEKTVKLGFRVERVDPAGIMSIRLAAVIDGVRIKWSDRGIVLRTASDSMLYGAVRIGSTADDTPLELTNTNDRISNLLSARDGLLRIDLAAFLSALGLSPDSILQGYLGSGALTVEAVISDLVFARGSGSGLRKLGDTSVSVTRGAGKAELSVTGAGLRGSVSVGR